MASDVSACDRCQADCNPTIDAGRLERIAVFPDGPTFLYRCRVCGALWHETLRYIKRITHEEARTLYPAAFPPDE
jgi:hypothetical protein